MAAAALRHRDDLPPPQQIVKYRRPNRKAHTRNPILWSGNPLPVQASDRTEYTSKYKTADVYRRGDAVTHLPQLVPNAGIFGQPSVYKHDYNTKDTARPYLNVPKDTLNYWRDYQEPVTTYSDQFIEQPWAKRDAIPRVGDHWVKPGKGFEDSTTSKDSYQPNYGYTPRASLKKERPYIRAGVKMPSDTTATSDYQWKYDTPRESFRPTAAALIPGPFESESHNSHVYLKYPEQVYAAAFNDDIYSDQPQKSSRPAAADGELVIPKKRGKPLSPEVPEERIMYATTDRSNGAISTRLEALKGTSPRHPTFASTYTRSYDKSLESFRPM